MYKNEATISLDTLASIAALLDRAEWYKWRGVIDGKARHYDTFHVEPSSLPMFPGLVQQFFLRIPPGGFVHKHTDKRKGYTYHVPIFTNQYCPCWVEGMPYHLDVGKIYSIDRRLLHWSENNGDFDRVHLLIETHDPLTF